MIRPSQLKKGNRKKKNDSKPPKTRLRKKGAIAGWKHDQDFEGESGKGRVYKTGEIKGENGRVSFVLNKPIGGEFHRKKQKIKKGLLGKRTLVEAGDFMANTGDVYSPDGNEEFVYKRKKRLPNARRQKKANGGPVSKTKIKAKRGSYDRGIKLEGDRALTGPGGSVTFNVHDGKKNLGTAEGTYKRKGSPKMRKRLFGGTKIIEKGTVTANGQTTKYRSKTKTKQKKDHLRGRAAHPRYL